MRRLGRWFNYQTKERPFFSALVVLLIVIVPGYARLESAVSTANDAAESANEAAISASATATQLSNLIAREQARDAATQLANCQTRNQASKNGRDRFDVFFTAIETIFTSSPDATQEQKDRTKQFIDSLRAAVPLDPTKEDVDCNADGTLTPADYG